MPRLGSMNNTTNESGEDLPPLRRFTLSSHLATASSPRSDSLDNDSFDSLTSQITSRALSTVSSSSLLSRRLELVESLSSRQDSVETVRETLRTEWTTWDEQTWNDLLEERWMEDLCPYPGCEYLAKNKRGRPSVPYDPDPEGKGQKAIFKLHWSGSLVEAKKAAFEPFCCKECRNRSDYYKELIVKRMARMKGKEKEPLPVPNSASRVELLEDIEVRRQKVWDAAKEDLVHSSTEQDTSIRSAPTKQPRADTLIIQENPTPLSPPTPPSLSAPLVDFERPLPASSSSTTRKRPSANSSLPTQTATLRPLSRPASSVPTHIQPPPSLALPGLPPPKWITGPTMVKLNMKTGEETEQEWDDDGEEGLTEEEKGWLEEGVRAIKEERERQRLQLVDEMEKLEAKR